MNITFCCFLMLVVLLYTSWLTIVEEMVAVLFPNVPG